MKYFIAATLLFIVSGCTTITPYITKAANKTAEGVNAYCDEVDANSRAQFREEVNGQLSSGRSITVECGQ